ncbi:efflux transporter outer membrane subunit [Pandoraea pnomenusa]|uniref:efflux transporter outer membrane subunit n=1 Tax=Pandoraea pnomenusa TaxID=93220 RepID=UPI003341C883
MLKRTFGVASASFMLASCNFAPTYERPSTTLQDTFAVTDFAPMSEARAAQEVTWQVFFRDPALHQLISRALERNQDFAAAVARIDQAKALYRIQRSAQLPTVAVGVDATRARIPNTPTGVASVANQFGAQVAVTAFELDFWGRVANLSESARRNYLATAYGARAFRISLIASVASTYYAILAGDEGVALSMHTAQTREYAREIARLRLQAGATSLVDYEQADILATQAETQLAELRRTTAQLRNQLAVLVGGPLSPELAQTQGIGNTEQFGPLDPGLPSAMLDRRPDIQAAEEALQAANADIGAARANFFPRISLTTTFGYVSTELSNLFTHGGQAWLLAGGASLPLWDWGARQAQLGFSEARRDELTANYRKAIQVAFQEVSDALIARQRLREQINAQERAVSAEARLAETAELRYQNGISIYLEVVDAQRSLFTAQQQLILLRAAELQNGATLYAALGGGQND